MSMEVIVTIVSKLVDFTYLRDLEPTYIGVITQLLSTMDIPVPPEKGWLEDDRLSFLGLSVTFQGRTVKLQVK